LRRLLSERYRERLPGVLSCYDRIIVTGTLLGVCYAKGMTALLSARQIRIFDYPRFAEPLRDRLRERAAALAAAVLLLLHRRRARNVAPMPSGRIHQNRLKMNRKIVARRGPLVLFSISLSQYENRCVKPGT